MKTILRLTLVAALAAFALSAAGCKQLEARDQLNRGVTAYKAAQFNEAIEHFQQAIQLDPTLVNAKLYLATAYQSQFIPGAPSDDNMKLAQEAIDEYKVILDADPNNANAIEGMARLDYDMGNLDDAQTNYEHAVQVSPSDPTAYYTLGAIAYQKTNKAILLARQSMGVSNIDAPMISKKSTAEQKKTCQSLSQQDSAILDSGIQSLNKALELKPDYADAMTYVNLLYREKADLTCGNDTERQADIKIANDFVNKSLATRKAEVAAANKASSGGVVMDTKPNNN